MDDDDDYGEREKCKNEAKRRNGEKSNVKSLL